jgi:uncharacterized protein
MNTDTQAQQQEPTPPGKDVTWQSRVIEEKKALDDKITKLQVFIGGDTFVNLEDDQADLLTQQLHVMTEYSVILGKRIAAFK